MANDIFPTPIHKLRSQQLKELRKMGVEKFGRRLLVPRFDGVCGTITATQTDSLIMELKERTDSNNYAGQPTKQELIAYFGDRLRVRKFTPTEAFRLMDLTDADIEKIQAYPFATMAERKAVLSQLSENSPERRKITRDSICKTQQYHLAGNSIVVSCLYYIFKSMYIAQSGQESHQQLTLSL
jgi:site-specific DNA-cytosine methylase